VFLTVERILPIINEADIIPIFVDSKFVACVPFIADIHPQRIEKILQG
jgi:hypothetical protein